MLLLSLFIILATWWCWYRWSQHRIYSFASKLPTLSPPPLPVIGQLYMLFLGYDWLEKRIMEVFFREGPSGSLKTIALWVPAPVIYFRDREDIQKIMNNSSSMDKSPKADVGKCIVGDGLLLASGYTWKVKRRYFQRLFQAKNLETLIPVLNMNCRKLVLKMSEHTGQTSVNVFPLLVTTALSSNCNLVYGERIEIDTESEIFKHLVHVVTRIPELGIVRQDYPWLRYDFIFNIIYKKELQYLRNVFDMFNAVYTKAQTKRPKPQDGVDGGHNSKDEAEESDSNYINCQMVYSHLEKEHPEILQDNGFIVEVKNFLLAGTDTIASTLSAGLLLLGKDQNVQDKLFKEIMSQVDVERDVTKDDLVKLPYLHQVYKETLRWANTVPLVLRQATRDIELSSYTVPAGSSLVLSISGLNCDPEKFPDPRRFDPERFSPENRLKIHRYDFLPFSGGPRNCIGKAYTDILAKLIFIHVVRNFKITTSLDLNKMKWKYAVIIFSGEGYPIQLERRSV